jgi:hypothetical protein
MLSGLFGVPRLLQDAIAKCEREYPGNWNIPKPDRLCSQTRCRCVAKAVNLKYNFEGYIAEVCKWEESRRWWTEYKAALHILARQALYECLRLNASCTA